jgi:hypothetical protein
MGEFLFWILEDIPAHVAFILAAGWHKQEQEQELYKALQPIDEDNSEL